MIGLERIIGCSMPLRRPCQVCHRYNEKEILARAETIQNKTQALLIRAEEAAVGLIQTLADLKKAGAPDALLSEVFYRTCRKRACARSGSRCLPRRSHG